MSDDGRLAIVIIAMLGNPFSPSYARARRRKGAADPLPYSSMNVALYARGPSSAWTLYERKVDARHRAAASLAIGKSTIGWEGDALVVRIDERTTPLGRPLRGTVRLHPEGLSGLEYAIDSERRHLWWPVAPLSRIEVNMNEPSVRFSGHGYHDANAGDVPLEATFRHWTWSRARQGQSALLTYDATTLDGAHSELAFALHHDGAVEPIDGAAHAPIGRSNWGLDRHVRVDQGFPARIVRSLEDGPFYSRALVETRLRGERVVAMHEVLAARRLKAWWVQHCIGYRMRRERFAF